VVYYLPKVEDKKTDINFHAKKPSNLKTGVSVVLLILSLIVVVGLAELLSPAIEAGVKAAKEYLKRLLVLQLRCLFYYQRALQQLELQSQSTSK